MGDVTEDSDEAPEEDLSDLLVVFGILGLVVLLLLTFSVTLSLVALKWIAS